MANKLEIRLLLLLLSIYVSCTVSQVVIPNLAPPVLRSCWELFEAGYTTNPTATGATGNGWTSGLYMIDPDGPDGTNPDPFQVDCDLSTGETIFSHNRAGPISVPSGNADPGSYASDVTYDYGTLEQIYALIDASESCSQTIQFECRGVKIWDDLGKPWTWWTSKVGNEAADSIIQQNWGSNYPTRGCECAETGTCAGGADARCNCDVGDSILRSDSGTITDKTQLPILQVRIGGVDTAGQEASFSLGELRCTGSTFNYRSCAAIDADTGDNWPLSYYYMIDPDAKGGEDPFLVYCDANGDTLVPHNLCDMDARTPNSPVNAPDCVVMGRGDTYKGRRFGDCMSAGCDSVDVLYNEFSDVGISQIGSLIDDASTSCEQELAAFCINSAYTPSNRWWEGRFALGTQRFNWGGATGGTDCAGNTCNCDTEDGNEQSDFGTITDEATLPIRKIFNGDTELIDEYAFVNVGALTCDGNKLLDECATNTDNCHANAVCTNTEARYECECGPGYFGDGFHCLAIIFYLECDNLTVVENELSVQFNVFRTGINPDQTSSVTVDFGNLEAIFGADFSDQNRVVTFPATTGSESNIQFVPISVNIIDDSIAESNETFMLSLSNPVNGQVNSGWYDTAIVNIIDDDATFEIELAKYEVSEEKGYVDICIIRWGSLDQTGSVVINSTEDTALAGSDFAAEGTRTIYFDLWERKKTVRIALLNDRVPEDTEQFFIGIEQPVNDELIRIMQTCITVTDEDTTLCPEFPTYTVLEDDMSLEIKLLRGGDLSEAGFVRVTAYLDGIRALRIPLDQEYITFPANAESITVRIDLTDDLIQETTENITFDIIDAGSDHVCNERRSLIVLSDDDSSFALGDTHFTIREGPGAQIGIPVVRNGYLGDTGSCRLTTSHITDQAESAVPGEDYLQRDTTVSFPNGIETQTVFIDIVNDNFKEDYEAFRVTLSDCEGGVLSQPNEAFVGIIDDDIVEDIPVLPTFKIAMQSYKVYESEGLVTVMVTKQGSGDASVRLATYPLESSASVTQDFLPVNERLDFTGATTTRTVSIPIINDNVPEYTEDIVVKLSNPINANLGEIDERKAVISVCDLDSIVYFRASEVSVSEGSEYAIVEVTRQGNLDEPQTVGVLLYYDTLPNEADLDDFEPLPLGLSFGIGERSAVAQIPIIDDLEVEGIEVFLVRLAVDPSRPGTLTVEEPSVVTVNILDNDTEGPAGDSNLPLIIGGSVAGGLIFLGVAGLALAVCFRALATPRVPERVTLPPKYLGPQPPPGYPNQPPVRYPQEQPPLGYPRNPYDRYPNQGAVNPAFNYGGVYPR
ncbi:uncharacterized protein [Amphiura filiformis]|uniref:uncharacterized protein n=1 Tax=Amphiura filiformis TaxID=82378 RepID=UPI003B2277A5